MKSLILIALLTVFFLLSTNDQLKAQTLDAQEKALKTISDFADALCRIPLEGKSAEAQLSGTAKLELKNLLTKTY